jgi:hypothetical protein
MDRRLQQIANHFEVLREKVEVLNGDRGGNPAIRRNQLTGLNQVSRAQQSKPITSAPTAADYNALVQDISRIFEALEQVNNSLR